MDDADDTPLPPLLIDSEPTGDAKPDFQPHPTAGKIYGRTKTFIDHFNDDKHALYRAQNPYYLFADQEEWELGSFLLRSGMSMQKVDEFLRLKLVP